MTESGRLSRRNEWEKKNSDRACSYKVCKKITIGVYIMHGVVHISSPEKGIHINGGEFWKQQHLI